jgi:hypothetical protein
VLSELLADLTGSAVPVDASAVFTEQLASRPAWRHLSHAALGEHGLPLESEPS